MFGGPPEAVIVHGHVGILMLVCLTFVHSLAVAALAAVALGLALNIVVTLVGSRYASPHSWQCQCARERQR